MNIRSLSPACGSDKLGRLRDSARNRPTPPESARRAPADLSGSPGLACRGEATSQRPGLGSMLAVLSLVLGPWLTAQGLPEAPERTFVLLSVQGTVEVAGSAAGPWTAARVGEVVVAGQHLRTAPFSRAALVASGDRTVLRVGPGTTLEAKPPRRGRSGLVWRVMRGFVYFFNRDKAIEEEFETPFATAGPLSTEFALAVLADRMELSVQQGTVELRTPTGPVVCGAGQSVRALAGVAPTPAPMIDVANVIQWCLYYPAVLEVDDLAFPAEATRALGASLAAYREGDFLAALARYPAVREPASDAERLYRAALALTVGEVEVASSLLGRVERSSGHGDALQALVSVVKNQSWERRSPPVTATDWLAESYCLQARAGAEPARLADALAAAKAATSASPRSGLAWTRRADLEFSHGLTALAHASLARARQLSPRNPQAMMLQGFALAARNDLEAAIQSFNEAIAADGALPDAWLGRGLCRIRQGDAAGGRTDLLIAAANAPTRSVLRSYLGKAFAEANQDAPAEVEWEQARRLDANDPTSSLYSALLRQRQNRINEAIHDLERSQELNDNRSLYRSGLLLDQDRAVRSANLARIYQDAGMDDVAFREAARALNSDYANYSAHLFLANSYEALRDPELFNLRYETAANSEYLVANLLAPVGAGVLSPSVSQQEYSKLFEQDRLRVNSVTDYTSNGDWAESGTVYGTFGSTSFALEGAYRSVNGWRPNNDSTQMQLALNVKQQVSPADTITLRAGLVELEGGDLSQRYDPATAHPTFRSREEQAPVITAGYHHEWRPGVDTLFLFTRVTDGYSFSAQPWPECFAGTAPADLCARSQWPALVFGRAATGVDFVQQMAVDQTYESDLGLNSVELQQLLRHSVSHLSVLGARGQWGDWTAQSRQTNPTDWQPSFPTQPNGDLEAVQELDEDFVRFDIYGYHTWQIVESLSVQAGVSYAHQSLPRNFLLTPLAGGAETQDQVSPKAGVIWQPWANTTVRGAYTRSLTGATFEQSYRLEPSQVAGFTQAYRSLIPESIAGPTPHSTLDTYNVSFEQRFRSATYVAIGGELLQAENSRAVGAYDVSTAWFVPSSLQEELEYQERSLVCTVNQLLGRDWSLGVKYRLTQSELSSDYSEVLPDAILTDFRPHQDLDSVLHQVGLQAVYNHPCGFFARVQALWNHQSNQGYSQEVAGYVWPDQPGDDFWQLSGWIGYRFAQRKAELAVGLLNWTDQDYQLSPLTPYYELPRARTLAVRLRVSL